MLQVCMSFFILKYGSISFIYLEGRFGLLQVCLCYRHLQPLERVAISNPQYGRNEGTYGKRQGLLQVCAGLFI